MIAQELAAVRKPTGWAECCDPPLARRSRRARAWLDQAHHRLASPLVMRVPEGLQDQWACDPSPDGVCAADPRIAAQTHRNPHVSAGISVDGPAGGDCCWHPKLPANGHFLLRSAERVRAGRPTTENRGVPGSSPGLAITCPKVEPPTSWFDYRPPPSIKKALQMGMFSR
jgi:hypothetical protein